MKALVDADILLYRVGYTTQEEPEGIAQYRMEELVNRILESVEATSYAFYLSDGRTSTFRAKINPDYKANRTQPKPIHYDMLKRYLIEAWNAEVQVEQEADDALGIAQWADYSWGLSEASESDTDPAWVAETVICSIDKDLLQIPGHHYNFVKEEHRYITPEEGLIFFYQQLLIGDTADNIKGVAGIGPKKAEKLLSGMEGKPEEEIFKVVQDAYRDWLQLEWADQYEEWGDFEEKQMNNIILMNGQCLKIRTIKDEVWNFKKTFNLKPETIPTLG